MIRTALLALALADVTAGERLASALHEARLEVERGGSIAPAAAEDLRSAAGAGGPRFAIELETALRAADATARHEALARLEARARALVKVEAIAGPAAAPDRGAARAALAAVLERREFARARKLEGSERGASGFWSSLFARLERWLESLGDRERDAAWNAGALPVDVFLWAVLAILLVLLVMLAVSALGVRARGGGAAPGAAGATAPTAAPGAEALLHSADAWLATAEQELARGDTRAALRSLYLALLSALHRGGWIEVRAARTNWEHAVVVARVLPAISASFRELTATFDGVVYGRKDPGRADCERARELARAVLEAAPARSSEVGR